MSALQSYLWLATLPGLGPQAANLAVQAFGSPDAVYAADRAALAASAAGLNRRQVECLMDKSLTRAHEILSDCEKKDIRILTLGDSAYPDRLRAIADPPLVLYVRGRWPDLDAAPGIAVVGSREPTSYGVRMAEGLGRSLAEAGFVTVSGMARGADAAAHRGALRGGGITVAVLAGGVDLCYPQENRRLMGDILLSGAVVSENPPGTVHKGGLFPARNRIISGLAVASVVVEARSYRSGTMLTAHHALDQGRDVYAVPGPVDAGCSAGCNELLERGEAAILTGPETLLRAYAGMLPAPPDSARVREAFLRQAGGQTADAKAAWQAVEQRQAVKPLSAPQADEPAAAKPLPENLTAEERQVAELVRGGALTPAELVEQCDMAPARVMSIVTMLEMDGILKRERGMLTINNEELGVRK